MPDQSDKKHFYIELCNGHSRHRFVRRHISEQNPTRKVDNQNKPTRLSWSFSMGAASTSKTPKPSKSRKERPTQVRGTSDMETECSETSCRTEAASVDSGYPDMFKSLGYVQDWRSATDESGRSGERKRRRRHHCRCRPLQQQIFYQPLYDSSQIQNNYYEHREHRLERKHQDVAEKSDDVKRLLPDLDRLSLANGHERASPPPAYSEICARSTDTPFVGHVSDFEFVSECQHDELDGSDRVEDWLCN